ncbi:MAG: thiamine ABC transporter substrate-binding protein [Trueperaceae bacterium]|nr:thiamine ABC transporter substrate-binding protein [Truepera sp.]
MRKLVKTTVSIILATLLGACAAERITVLTHDSFALPAELVSDFTKSTGIEVSFLKAGDAGEVVNRAVLTKSRPLADVLFGVDESLLERVRSEGIFEPYLSPRLADVRADFIFDPTGLITPVDVGYVLPNVDVAWFSKQGLELPTGLADLAAPAYRGVSVVENPATSSPGLAFLLATVVRFGDDEAGVMGADAKYADWLDFWAALAANDLEVADGWSDAYYTLFTRYGGDRPLVVSYATSPAAEVIFADEPLTESPTANLQCPGCAYRQVEGVGILRGTKHRAAAEAFVDFMLSPAVQAAIPAAMFVNPVVVGTELPREFDLYAQVGEDVVAEPLPAATVQANQARWLRQWTAVVLQGRDPASVR